MRRSSVLLSHLSHSRCRFSPRLHESGSSIESWRWRFVFHCQHQQSIASRAGDISTPANMLSVDPFTAGFLQWRTRFGGVRLAAYESRLILLTDSATQIQKASRRTISHKNNRPHTIGKLHSMEETKLLHGQASFLERRSAFKYYSVKVAT